MDERRSNLVIGAFVASALALLAGSLLVLGAGRSLLQPHYRLITYFENVEGLVAGAPVRLAGRDVGTVERLSFAPLGSGLPPIRVDLQVRRSVRDRIRSDSVARIGTIGLLGDKFVDVSMGSTQGEVLDEGAELASVSPLDLSTVVTRGTEAIDNVARLAENMNKVVMEFGDAMGGRSIAQATEGMASIVRQVQQGDGLLHQLIYEPADGGAFAKADRTLGSAEEIFEEIAHGRGLLHQLIYEAPPDRAVLSDTLQAAGRLSSVLAKIDDGEGTLGLLVNDPSLYEDLKRLVGGAQRSLVVRSLIKLSTEGD